MRSLVSPFQGFPELLPLPTAEAVGAKALRPSPGQGESQSKATLLSPMEIHNICTDLGGPIPGKLGSR